MPTIFTHPLPVVALAAGLGARIIPPRLAVAAVLCSVLPDLDAAGYFLGQTGGLLAHRGFSHSLVAALLMGCLGFLAAPWLRSRRPVAFLVLALATASHGLLDALTTGGSGVAFFWPFETTRYFLPWRPVLVSPIRPDNFFTERGLRVLLSEACWIWGPCLVVALSGLGWRMYRKKRGRG